MLVEKDTLLNLEFIEDIKSFVQQYKNLQTRKLFYLF